MNVENMYLDHYHPVFELNNVLDLGSLRAPYVDELGIFSNGNSLSLCHYYFHWHRKDFLLCYLFLRLID